MLHHFLTGDASSREAVLELAGWVVDMDDGSQSVFRWLTRSYTGLASNTRSGDYHGPGRGAGIRFTRCSMRIDSPARRATSRRRRVLIRRCIHPDR